MFNEIILEYDGIILDSDGINMGLIWDYDGINMGSPFGVTNHGMFKSIENSTEISWENSRDFVLVRYSHVG